MLSQAFGEDSTIISTSSTSKTELTPKTISGLTVIQEDVAAESQSAEEPARVSGGETQSDQDVMLELDSDVKPDSDAKTDQNENPPASGLESQSEEAVLNESEGGMEQTDQEGGLSADPS